MIEQGFRGNCDSLGKLGMCPSLAEPDSSGFPRNGFHNVSRETLLLGIPPESGSARLGHIPSLPWKSQLPLKPCISLQPFDLKGNCDSL